MEQEKAAGAREARREEWRRIIEEQRAGGQGAAAYCRERGIPVWKFSYWRKALDAGYDAAEIEKRLKSLQDKQ